MENNEKYCYFGKTLFKTNANGDDFWVNQKFNSSWQNVSFENGPHPCSDYSELDRDSALEFAKQLGMSEEEFNK